VKERSIFTFAWNNSKVVLVLGLLVTLLAGSVYSQQPPATTPTQASTTTQATTPPTPSPAVTEAEAIQRRLARARALAAAHLLTAAVSELETLRTQTTEETVRDVARIMLMDIHLEQADYTRALALLEETFTARNAQSESSIRAYYTLAGQSVKGSRSHLDRYRSFGINVADKDLPSEATSDLDRMRHLLERVAAQAKEINNENAQSTEAVALLEDVANVRGTLARNREERQHWQRERENARQKLVASETRLASLRGAAIARPSTIPASSSTASRNNAGVNNSSGAPATTSSPSAPTTSQPTNPRQSASPSNTSGQGVAANVPTSGQPLEVGSLIERAKERVSPKYPQTARAARITGVVTVYLVIDESGTVTMVKSSTGPQMLRSAAEDAARRWKFQPTMVEGQPVRVAGFINFNFTL
jgi:TonB family protein